MAWEVALVALVLLLGLSVLAVGRGDVLDRIVGVQLAGVHATLIAVVLAVATGRRVVLDVALVLAALTLAGGLAYARVVERWL
jgi:multisubunit Na+/H+ antiporter MnhF subunit